jgi:hypothetical protein
MRQIYLMGLIALLLVSPTIAFREVTCGHGQIGGLCHERELQDEFDEVHQLILDIEDNEWATQDDIDDLWLELDSIQEELDRQKWMDKMLLLKTKCNKHKIKKLSNYVRMNEDRWSQDTVGGNGLSTDDLAKKLSGNKKLFRVYPWYVDYLYTIFVTHQQHELIQLRLDRIEARAFFGPDYTDCDVALITAKRTGNRVTFGDGFIADPRLGGCVRLS